MAAPFKIPKRKQPTEPGFCQMQSPLSRLQYTSPFKTTDKQSNWCNGPSNGKGVDKIVSLNGHSSRAGKESTPNRPVFRDVVKARLGLGHPSKGISGQSTPFQRSSWPTDQLPANQRGDSPGHSQWREPDIHKSPPSCHRSINGAPKKQTQESLAEKKPSYIQSSPVTSTHKAGQRLPISTPSPFKNGWRPKRASDSLCQDENQLSPQMKTQRGGLNELSVQCSPVESEEDSAPELSPEREMSNSSRTGERCSFSLVLKQRKPDSGMNGTISEHTEERTRLGMGNSGLGLRNGVKKDSPSGMGTSGSVPVPPHPDPSSDDDVPPNSPRTPGSRVSVPMGSARHPSSKSSASRAVHERRLSLNRTSLHAKHNNLRDRELERKAATKSLSLHLRLKRPKHTTSEPIVLSSEDEEGQDEEGSREGTTSQSPRLRAAQHCYSPRDRQSTLEEHTLTQAVVGENITGSREREQKPGSPQQLPPIMELPFITLHAGLVRAEANGNITVTDDGITLPLKGPRGEEEERVSVSLVASQLLGYGVWDGGLAQDGSLFQDWEGPAPSLLFLWVSEAQANLIQTELSTIHPITLADQSCPFLLLVLSEQLGDLKTALLTSMLDVEGFHQGRSHDFKSPLSWAECLVLIHSCAQDTHLLSLLGQNAYSDLELSCQVKQGQESPSGTRATHRSRVPYFKLQRLPSRLIQYPSPPSKGRIVVTTEDLECLDSGQFLNDVIIDFYLKYLVLEKAPRAVAERCHIFSSFFYKQLTRRDTSCEEAAAIPTRDRRHQRVRTWTRHVDIFNKDYLFVPVNQEAHWYLVVICFPGLEQAQHEEWQGPASVAANGVKRKHEPQAAGPSSEVRRLNNSTSKVSLAKECGAVPGGIGGARAKPTHCTLRLQNPPECTQDGCQKETVCKRPCIVVMDSLKLSFHERIYKLLREYLQVEWEVRRGTPRDFTADSMKGSHCRVPLQDNSSDCGLYLLQYVESFLQNPVVHFELPLRLEHWFPRQRVWRKREELRSLVMELHSRQGNSESSNR